jgi:hypothetical protein
LCIWFGCGCEFGYETGAVVHPWEVLGEIGAGFAEHCAFCRLLLVGFADLQGGFATPGVGPALDEPARMAEALGEGGYRLVDADAGLLGGGYLAKDGVDHAGGVGLVGGAAELDAFAEGGMGGDAIEVEELKGSDAEGDGYRLGEALLGTLEEGADAGVECYLPAQNSHDQCGGEVAVFRSEFRGVSGVEEIVAVAFVLADESEDLECRQTSGGDFFEGGFDGRCGTSGGGTLARECWFRSGFGDWFGQREFSLIVLSDPRIL